MNQLQGAVRNLQNSLTLKLLISAFLPLVLVGCAARKPCAEAGDISWPNEIKGDKVCFQKKNEDGKYVNNGKFTIYHKNKRPALRGLFENSERQGRWAEYDDKGKPVLEKYYEKGMEYSPPLEIVQKERERDDKELRQEFPDDAKKSTKPK